MGTSPSSVYRLTHFVSRWTRGRNVVTCNGNVAITIVIAITLWGLKPCSLKKPVGYHYQSFLGSQNLTEVPVIFVTLRMRTGPNLLQLQRWAVCIMPLTPKVQQGKARQGKAMALQMFLMFGVHNSHTVN